MSDWATLDKLNKTHYGRNKPRDLRDAEENLELAASEADRAIDNYYDRHYGDAHFYRIMQTRQDELKAAESKYADVAARYGWRAPEDAYLEQRFETSEF